MDGRVNPDSFLEINRGLGQGSWIAIGSANLPNKAPERDENGVIYGNFTWFWAKSLSNVQKGETWLQVYNRTLAYMYQALMAKQDPVMEGVFNRPVIEKEDTVPNRSTFTVMDVFTRDNENRAKINVGLLLGIEPGSEFILGDANTPLAKLEVINSEPLKCEALIIEGSVSVGDTVSLNSWMPPSFTVKTYFRSALPEDSELLVEVKESLLSIQAVEEVKETNEADLVVWVLRPIPSAPSAGEDTSIGLLPSSDPNILPAVWLVDPSENSFFWGQDRLRAPLNEEGLTTLKENFIKASRARAILDLPAPPGQPLDVDISYLLFAPCSEEEYQLTPNDQRFKSQNNDTWKLISEVKPTDDPIQRNNGINLLFVKVKNNTKRKFYVYGINITLTGDIIPFLPNPDFITTTEVDAGTTMTFLDSAVLFSDPEEYIRIIVTDSPFNISILAQTGLQRATRSLNNPPSFLETIVGDRLTLSNTRSAKGMDKTRFQWTTIKSLITE
jgi:hypothetical protein